MKYEEIKIGDVFSYQGSEQTVISKSDKYRIITTIDSKIRATTWLENDLQFIEPIKEELPEEGLLVSKAGSLVDKLPDGSGYGFIGGRQSDYYFNDGWNFQVDSHWKPATPEQEKEFVKMLKKECEKRGLFEDTKIEKNAEGLEASNINVSWLHADATEIFNRNGRIFYKGKFATPLKEEEETLELVSKAVQDIGIFTVEQTESGVIILTPIKK